MDELRTAGHSVPSGNGKTLCATWVRQQWLCRDPGEVKEQYRLTSHTQDALNIIEEMTRERSFLSGSRITTILETVSRVATDANPDRQERSDRSAGDGSGRTDGTYTPGSAAVFVQPARLHGAEATTADTIDPPT